jgi:hypothetical protein
MSIQNRKRETINDESKTDLENALNKNNNG